MNPNGMAPSVIARNARQITESALGEAEGLFDTISKSNNRELISRLRLDLKTRLSKINMVVGALHQHPVPTTVREYVMASQTRVRDLSTMALATFEKVDDATERESMHYWVRKALIEAYGKERQLEIMQRAAVLMQEHKEQHVPRPAMSAGTIITLGSSGGARSRK